MNDVWIVIQEVKYTDGSTRRFVSSVHGSKESVDARVTQKETRRDLNRRRRTSAWGDIVSSEYTVERWFVQ